MRTFQAFSEEIQVVAVPQRFREPVKTTYNSSSDTHDHIAAFQTQMFITGEDDATSCKMYTTLKDVAVRLFIGLPPRSITNFEDLTSRFTF